MLHRANGDASALLRASLEEIGRARILEFTQLLAARMRGGSWTGRDGVTRPLEGTDFMVVAPYNIQVRRGECTTIQYISRDWSLRELEERRL